MMRRRAWAGLGALGAALLGVLALRAGLAGVDGRIAQDALVRLDAGQRLAPQAFADAQAAARSARRRAPRAGAPDEWLARLALHEAALAADPGRARAARAAAREHARAALQARPRWPYAAALLARVEAADQRFGVRFADAVRAAWSTGRHERRVREALARLWLDPAARGRVPELGAAFDTALAAEPEAWIDAADRAGAADAACARAAALPRALARCEALGWLAPPRADAAAPRG